MIWKIPSNDCFASASTSSLNEVTSTTPTSRPSDSTTGNARNRRFTKYSAATSTVAQEGIATTSAIMMSEMRDSAAFVSSRRIGTTPTRRSFSSTT